MAFWGNGIMDSDFMWDIEEFIKEELKFKPDDKNYTVISPHGYDQYYKENREILRNADIRKTFTKIKTKYHEYDFEDPFILSVIGFLYLQYQLNVPDILKDAISQICENEIALYKKNKRDYMERIDVLNKFKEAINKSNGYGVKTVGVHLPPRNIFD